MHTDHVDLNARAGRTAGNGDGLTTGTAAIARTGPLVICVRGMIALPASPQMHNVTSDKSILGIGASSGFTGGGLNVGLPVDDATTSPPANAVHNVIIRNLVFRNATDDSTLDATKPPETPSDEDARDLFKVMKKREF